MITPPIASRTAPISQQTREPQRSRMVPTGKADTFAVIDAIVKNRFNLSQSALKSIVRPQYPHVRRDIPEILLGAQFHPLRYFSGGATLPVDAFFDEDGLQSREAEDDTRRAPAREDGHNDLDWMSSDGVLPFGG